MVCYRAISMSSSFSCCWNIHKKCNGISKCIVSISFWMLFFSRLAELRKKQNAIIVDSLLFLFSVISHVRVQLGMHRKENANLTVDGRKTCSAKVYGE